MRRWPAAIAVNAANATPDAVAVVDGEETLTYAELERRSGRLAAYLRTLGVRRDVVVGIALGRSVAAVVAALGILRAGGAFLPLDPAQPLERSCYELGDADACAVICSARAALPRTEGCALVTVDRAGDIVGRPVTDRSEPAFADVAQIDDSDLAYVIYTSGSTGRPKGVEIPHAGLANLIAWHHSAFGLTSTDRVSHLCAVGFDAAIWEVWPALASGATVVITPDLVSQDAHALRDWLIANEVTTAFAPTALAEQLIDLAWPSQVPLRLLLTGADRLHAFPAAELPFALVNNYGPTEATVVATSGLIVPIDAGSAGLRLPSIGRPIRHTEVALVAANDRLVAAGEPGEIWIAGAGLARGYRGRPDLTARRFVTACFDGLTEQRYYRTGDIGRYQPDGTLDFLGRNDDQINLRGYRIEPAEIEAALNAHPAIRASAVVAIAISNGVDALLAYVVAPELPATAELRAFLAARLPAYMLPTTVLPLAKLPLTPRGKLDRAALRVRPAQPALVSEPLGDGTSTLARLTQIVGALFGLPTIRSDDSLLTIGGNSLFVAKLVARIRDAFHVEVSLRQAFDARSIAALAADIERLTQQPADECRTIAPIVRRERVLH